MTGSPRPDSKGSEGKLGDNEKTDDPSRLTDSQMDVVIGGMGDIVVTKTTDKASVPP